MIMIVRTILSSHNYKKTGPNINPYRPAEIIGRIYKAINSETDVLIFLRYLLVEIQISFHAAAFLASPRRRKYFSISTRNRTLEEMPTIHSHCSALIAAVPKSVCNGGK